MTPVVRKKKTAIASAFIGCAMALMTPFLSNAHAAEMMCYDFDDQGTQASVCLPMIPESDSMDPQGEIDITMNEPNGKSVRMVLHPFKQTSVMTITGNGKTLVVKDSFALAEDDVLMISAHLTEGGHTRALPCSDQHVRQARRDGNKALGFLSSVLAQQ